MRFARVISLVFVACTMWNLNGYAAKRYTRQTCSEAMDAFNRAFYNPEMKLYAITSDGKGRAAIWVQAIYWDMVMNAYSRTKDKKYLKLIGDIYRGGYEQYAGYDWTKQREWFIYDDMMWWIISLGRAYQITGETTYLAHAATGFWYVWREAYDKEEGGMWWNFKHDAKMSCINYPTIVGAMTLYEVTRDSSYLKKAQDLYSWSRRVFFDSKQGRIADNMHYHFQRPNGMDIDWTTQLYNQGTFIGAATMLYAATKQETYLNDALLCANYVKEHMCNADGLLPYKTGIEQGIYAAIFAQYLARLVKEVPGTEYKDWMRHNVDVAWSNRDAARNLTFKNFAESCPTGLMESYDASACPALMQLFPAE